MQKIAREIRQQDGIQSRIFCGLNSSDHHDSANLGSWETLIGAKRR